MPVRCKQAIPMPVLCPSQWPPTHSKLLHTAVLCNCLMPPLPSRATCIVTANIKALSRLMLLCWLQLAVLDLSNSGLIGSLPDAWSQLTKVSLFYLLSLSKLFFCVSSIVQASFWQTKHISDLVAHTLSLSCSNMQLRKQGHHKLHILVELPGTISCYHRCCCMQQRVFWHLSLVFDVRVWSLMLEFARTCCTLRECTTLLLVGIPWCCCLPIDVASSDDCDAVDNLEIGQYPGEWYSSSVLEPVGTGKLAASGEHHLHTVCAYMFLMQS